MRFKIFDLKFRNSCKSIIGSCNSILISEISVRCFDLFVKFVFICVISVCCFLFVIYLFDIV